MNLLRELLTINERAGSQDLHADYAWRGDVVNRATGEKQDYWIVTPQGKKHGPFGSKQRAHLFLQKRDDIPSNSKLQSVRKGSTI
jgi:hypothetical protein